MTDRKAERQKGRKAERQKGRKAERQRGGKAVSTALGAFESTTGMKSHIAVEIHNDNN